MRSPEQNRSSWAAPCCGAAWTCGVARLGWAGWSCKMGVVLHWVPKTLLLPSSVVVITQSFQTVVSLEVALFFLGSFVEMVWFNLRCCLIYSLQMTFWSLSQCCCFSSGRPGMPAARAAVRCRAAPLSSNTLHTWIAWEMVWGVSEI